METLVVSDCISGSLAQVCRFDGNKLTNRSWSQSRRSAVCKSETLLTGTSRDQETSQGENIRLSTTAALVPVSVKVALLQKFRNCLGWITNGCINICSKDNIHIF